VEKKEEDGESFITRAFTICAHHEVLCGYLMMGRACGMYWGDEKSMQGFGGETSGKKIISKI
jgi:hypothetical protein